jgi:hypothetical protein
MTWVPDPATASVFATMSINGGIGIVVWLLFELFRGTIEVYAPRARSMRHRTPEAPKQGFLAWFPAVRDITDEDLLKSVGVDGYVFFRFLRACWYIFAICGSVGLVVLLPVYSTAPGNKGVAGINLYSMGNVESQGSRLWAPWILTYLFTGVFLYFMYKEYEHFVVIRRKFLREGDQDINEQKNYSVQVENVPVEFRSSEKLKSFFEQLFPGEVLFACISVTATPLSKAVAERKAAVANLEGAIAAFEGDPEKKRPEIKLNKKGKPAMCGGKEVVDAIEYWTKAVKELDAEVDRLKSMAITAENAAVLTAEQVAAAEAEEAEAKKDKKKKDKKAKITKKDVSGTGFVTFASRRAQVSACQMAVLDEKHFDVMVFPAPAPSDLIWSNIATPPAHTEKVAAVTSVVYRLGLLFWGLVLAFIAAVSTLSNLAKFLPFVNSLDPVSYAIIAGQLPIIIVIVFIALLPVFMSLISTYAEKRKTVSGVQKEVFRWSVQALILSYLIIMLTNSLFRD